MSASETRDIIGFERNADGIAIAVVVSVVVLLSSVSSSSLTALETSLKYSNWRRRVKFVYATGPYDARFC
eukprot:2314381-Rhodomonas_salina.1